MNTQPQQQQVEVPKPDLSYLNSLVAALRKGNPRVMPGTVVPRPNFIPGSPGAMPSTLLPEGTQ